MLKKIVLVLGAVVIVLVAVVATRPDTFHVERSAQVAAPPGAVFALVNDFHQWGQWSPWDKFDPAMKKTYSGAAAGSGAVYEWAGNKQVGRGRMTILDSRPGEQVTIKLEFIEPFPATHQAAFTFAQEGGGTRVTWSMDGRNNFFLKAMSLAGGMDKMIGGDFERGLAAMRSAAEATKRAEAPHPQPL